MADPASKTLPPLDFYLPLDRTPSTSEAKALGDALAHAAKWVNDTSRKQGRGRPKNRAGDIAALTAIVADILVGTQKTRTRAFYRSLSPNSFSGQPVSYHAFNTAMTWLEQNGWISKKYKGYLAKTFEGERIKGAKGVATRWTATDKLFEFVDAQGFERLNADQHFIAPDTLPVLELKRSSWREGPDKISGKSIKFTPTPQTERLEAEVKLLNDFLSKQTFTGFEFEKLRRIFNDGDNPKAYKWDKGGRLYATGNNNFQSLSKKKRAKITINGEPVIELDVRASHLTIFYGLRKAPLDKTVDPYKLPEFPRWLVKAWLTKAFGNGDLPVKYPQELYDEYRTKHGSELGDVYPIRDVTEAILEHHPVLKGLRKSGLDSLKLTYIESQIFISVMEHLIAHKSIPSLPMHDGLIVPKKAEVLTRNFIGDHYQHFAGIRPYISGEDRWDL